MTTLFPQAPSFDGFDGGAGSRYQAKREIKSFWHPTWLAQPAAMVSDSRVLDAPADELSVEDTLKIKEDIYHGVETFYKSFYFRLSKIWEIIKEMLLNWDMMKRRLREGVEFFHFLRAHGA